MVSTTPLDMFVYNGLGLRVGKSDSTGTYSYICDGASAGSPVLWDGHAIYTPGISESRAGVSTYSAYDVLGNLWFVDNASAAQTFYQDTTAFGSGAGLGIGGTEAGPFKFGGGNGCQVEADTGYVLMGHRYYDPRIGRFITQDPAGEGDNWYSYAGNNPTNKIDPLGLWIDKPFPEPDGTPVNQEITDTVQNGGFPGETYDVTKGGKVTSTFTIPAGSVLSWNGFHILVPPGVSIANNMSRVHQYSKIHFFETPKWFNNLVRNNKDHHLPLTGPNASFDYKQLNGAYAAFGNFNYGAAGAAAVDEGVFKDEFLQRMAGYAQVRSGTSQPGWGSPLGGPPYGDDPADQAFINAGLDYGHNKDGMLP